MVLKFFLFLLVLPLVIAVVLAFQAQALGIPVHKEECLLWGGLVFVLLYLFLYNFKAVFVFGQTIVSNLLRSAQPLAGPGSLIIPIYTVLIACVYMIIKVIGLGAKYEGWLLLGLGFSVAMHIVLTAHQLHEDDPSPIKSNYFLNFGLVLMGELLVIALLLGFLIPEYSFLHFLKSSFRQSFVYYQRIYEILFVSRS